MQLNTKIQYDLACVAECFDYVYILEFDVLGVRISLSGSQKQT